MGWFLDDGVRLEIRGCRDTGEERFVVPLVYVLIF